MRTVKEGVHKFERNCIVVHLFEEVFHVVWMIIKLVRADTRDVTLIITLFVVN